MSASLISPTSSDAKYNIESRWVIQIRRTLEEELEEDDEFPVSIFKVPKLLMASDPHSYVPQHVAIGPYHYLRPELYEMERCKLAAAKRFQKQLQCQKLKILVDQLKKLEQRIRASYHKFLDFNGETLVWTMAVDASFLLEFLQVYAIQEGTEVPGASSVMSHVIDYAGKKSAHNAILRDIVMLENQIPLFVLRKMMEFKFSSLETADDMLILMFKGLFQELSPFKMMVDYPNIQCSERAHLLGFLYDMMVPKSEEQHDDIIVAEDQHENKEGKKKINTDPSYVKIFFSKLWRLLSKLALIEKVIPSRPVKFIGMLPWTMISNLPGVNFLKQLVEQFFSSKENEDLKGENEKSSSTSLINEPPRIEEITIPSVSELSSCGIRFLPTKGGITSIGFDAKKHTLYLPTISLDVNTKVFLRNLVAYEASVISEPLIVTRYTEFMNGIVDYDEDARILREKCIILNHLKTDKEVADLWNGMSKSLRLTKVPFLDKVIEDVNKYYNGRFKVKAYKLVKAYVFSSWQILTFVSAFLLLLLMTLQAFCSIYTCNQFFHLNITTTESD